LNTGERPAGDPSERCHGAVERMGGAVGVESEHGAESRFWIDLQRA
jgi:hypothetical protein